MLHRPRRAEWIALALGSVIGVGNFFTLPSLVIQAGGLSVILVHLIGLFFLGFTLLLGELMWSEWLQKPYVDSFRVFHANFVWLTLFSFMAVSLITPPYALELGRLFLQIKNTLANGGFISSSFRLQIESNYIASYLSAFAILILCLIGMVLFQELLAYFFMGCLFFILLVWLLISVHIVDVWGTLGMHSLFLWNFSKITPAIILKIVGFSLFTLSSGFGLIYTLNFIFIKKSKEVAHHRRTRKPAELLKLAILLILGDLFATFTSIVMVSPYAMYSSEGIQKISSIHLILQWLPEILVRTEYGLILLPLFFVSLFLAGLLSFITLLEFALSNLESELKWTRRRAATHLAILGAPMLVLPLIPLFSNFMNHLGEDVFIPLAGLVFCYFAGWKMPVRAHQTLWGRGLILDSSLFIWRFSIRYLTPCFLIYYLMSQL